MTRLAVLDLDNTLVDRAEAFRRWAGLFRAEHDLPADATAWLVAADGDGFVARDGFFARIRERFGLATPAEQLWAAYRRRMPELVTCRPAVLAALDALRARGWRLAIATNGMADNQLGKIRRIGLDRHVDGWAISGEVGIRKPDRGLFEAAARACGARLDDGGWVVGDSPVLDVAGGRAAGLATAWVSRGQDWPADLAPPDLTAPDVETALAGIGAADR